MNSEPDDLDELVQALRADLPSERDAARIRTRLAALGIAFGTALTTTSTAGAALAGAKSTNAGVGLWAKLSGLSAGAKVGLAAAVSVPAVSAPLWLGTVAEPAPVTTTAAASLRAPVLAPARRQSATPGPTTTDAAAAAQPPVVEARAPAPAPIPRRSVSTSASGAGTTSAAAARTGAGSPPLDGAARSGVESPSSAASLADDVELDAARDEPAGAPSEPRGSDAAARSGDTARPAALAKPAAVPPSTLREETTLMDAAFTALGAGELDAASRHVREHARRFPNGLLRRERERAERALLERGRAEP